MIWRVPPLTVMLPALVRLIPLRISAPVPFFVSVNPARFTDPFWPVIDPSRIACCALVLETVASPLRVKFVMDALALVLELPSAPTPDKVRLDRLCALRSRVAPEATTTPEVAPSAEAPPSFKVPAFTEVAPL